jgi:hypothetical protein
MPGAYQATPPPGKPGNGFLHASKRGQERAQRGKFVNMHFSFDNLVIKCYFGMVRMVKVKMIQLANPKPACTGVPRHHQPLARGSHEKSAIPRTFRIMNKLYQLSMLLLGALPSSLDLHCNPSESRIPAKIFSRRGAEAQRKQCMAFLVGLSLRLCASARDIPSARFWLRLAALCVLRLFAANRHNVLSMNVLHKYNAHFNQG